MVLVLPGEKGFFEFLYLPQVLLFPFLKGLQLTILRIKFVNFFVEIIEVDEMLGIGSCVREGVPLRALSLWSSKSLVSLW